MPRILVAGGGAAGYFAAIRAREVCSRVEVALFESLSRPLGKVKISGGGRCNVTHHCFDAGRLVGFYPRGGRALRGVFERCGPLDVARWFESRGVRLKTEEDGRMFPITDSSQTIIDCLEREAARAGVQVALRRGLRAARRTAGGFTVDFGGVEERGDALLLATGSNDAGYACVVALGHGLVRPVPSLFTFKVADPRLEGLAGVSVPRVVGRLVVPEHPPVVQEGPLLVTHWGLSGPVVLRLSAWGARALHEVGYQATLLVDFFPDTGQEQVRATLFEAKARSRKHAGNDCPWDFPRRLWESLLRHAGGDPEAAWPALPNKVLNRLAEELKRGSFRVSGKGAFKEEFVTAGGVPLDEVDLRTMESRCCPGLYLAGEILDVDALTGGFNFQNAWSTGWIAGSAAAESLR
ncbi:MAG: NAD(P)/FAD-dependent oxidoreductase [Armatimonadetes bacterium]|nr:NAD(P)/FAD-dependent oxidoreductase [Armatimonadota bacterium]